MVKLMAKRCLLRIIKAICLKIPQMRTGKIRECPHLQCNHFAMDHSGRAHKSSGIVIEDIFNLMLFKLNIYYLPVTPT